MSRPVVDQQEARLENVLSIVLLVGVAASAILVTAGLVASFVVGWTGSLTHGAAADVATTDFSDLLGRLIALQPLAIAQAGLVVLVATPVFRVGVSIVGFARQRDRLYVCLAAIVLALLLVSLVGLR